MFLEQIKKILAKMSFKNDRVNVLICGMLAAIGLTAVSATGVYGLQPAEEIVQNNPEITETIALEAEPILAEEEVEIEQTPTPKPKATVKPTEKPEAPRPTERIVLAGRGDVTRYSKVITATATAYCACTICTGSGNGRTATGAVAQRGVIAVDPKVIPLGSRVYVETDGGGYVYGAAVAADTGGAIRGNKVDLCFNTHSEALAFGRRTVQVYIE
jgi:3D (Asp-Asp-Asp) domain-containing protein